MVAAWLFGEDNPGLGLKAEGIMPTKRVNAPNRDKRKDHGGLWLPADAEFLAPPPQEIGEVLSAYTSRRLAENPWPLWMAILVPLVGMILTAGVAIVLFIAMPHKATSYIVVGLGVIVWLSLIGLVMKRHAHRCTYVGRDGIARFRAWGPGRCRQQILLFGEACSLYTSVLDHYKGFVVYTHTTYEYEWLDQSGRLMFRIGGQHSDRGGMPPSTNGYHFAQAAEDAWTAYLLPEARRDLDSGEMVYFGLRTRGCWVGLGDAAITFCSYEPQTWEAENLGPVHVKGDVVYFQDASGAALGFDSAIEDKWSGWDPIGSDRQGAFKISSLANSRLFFLLVAEKLGLNVLSGS